MQAQEAKSFIEYLDIVRRRKMTLILVTAAVMLASVVLAYGIPPVYRSTGRILVEYQDIPSDMAYTTVLSYAQQRIDAITGQVVSSSNLEKIIRKFDLYTKQREKKDIEEIIEAVRLNIEIETETGIVRDPRSDRGTEGVVAFFVSYEDSVPETAQDVAADLVDLYLKENFEKRNQAVTDTSSLLAREEGVLRSQIDDVETRIAAFKSQNEGMLPEQQPINQQILQRVEQMLLQQEDEERSLEQRILVLRNSLAQVNPYAASDFEGGSGQPMTAEQRLIALQSEYLSKSAVYSETHPDLIRLRKEVEILENDLGGGASGAGLRIRLNELRSELRAARGRYSPEHPTVKKLQGEVTSFEKQMDSYSLRPTNPVYVQLKGDLQVAESDLKALRLRQDQLGGKLDLYEERTRKAPEVEREYRVLVRDHENMLEKYQEVRRKQGNARIAETLESEQKGERFILIEPPNLPREPVQPDRKRILTVGLAGSLASGFGALFFLENLSDVVRGVGGVAAVAGAHPLAVIPYIRNKSDRWRARRKILIWMLSILAILIVAALLIHFLWMPLGDLMAYATDQSQ